MSSPAGSGAEPQASTILVHFKLKRKHLVLCKSQFSEAVQLFKKRKFLIIAKEIILFPVRSGTHPGKPSSSVNSREYHTTGPSHLERLGERSKLPQRGLGRSPSRQRFWCILDRNESTSCYINSSFSTLRLFKNIFF